MIKPKQSRLILGLMSGTSHDGVDAALVRIRAAKPRLMHHCHFLYPLSLRQKIASASDMSVHEICRLNFELGEIFAKAALRCIEGSGFSAKAVDAIASHGQTIYHIPPAYNKRGSTLQIGEAAVISQRTGIPVVSNFRVADMAAGGEGAPLVPYADYLLFHGKGKGIRAVQNIGGIANVTVVTPEVEDVFAFDTGPGNCLIDEAMQCLFGKPIDRGGRVAQKGAPDPDLLETLLSHPYFLKKPPKSTGRETFGKEMIEMACKSRRITPEDLIATFTHLTARSIKEAYERFIIPRHNIREVILSGGGARNGYLLSLLRDLLSPLRIKLIDDYGIPAEAKEALSFAVLANETLSGRPANLPRVTGAQKRVILGSIYMP